MKSFEQFQSTEKGIEDKNEIGGEELKEEGVLMKLAKSKAGKTMALFLCLSSLSMAGGCACSTQNLEELRSQWCTKVEDALKKEANNMIKSSLEKDNVDTVNSESEEELQDNK